MVRFLFIRHGESKDNLRGVWAGWKDSPLSNHGMKQAEALAESLSHIKLSAIYSSDLLRAKSTAQAVKKKQLDVNVPHHELTALREQHFGSGEGMKFGKREQGLSLEAHYAKGKYPVLYDRQQSYPGGESLDDIAKRAEMVIDEILFPHLLQEREEGILRTVAVVSHGLFIRELMAAITRRDPTDNSAQNSHSFGGMKNTAWMGVEIALKDEPNPLSGDSSRLNVKVTEVNEHAHLSNVHRQRGGIGSLAHDPAQKDLRAFFGKQATELKSTRVKPY